MPNYQNEQHLSCTFALYDPSRFSTLFFIIRIIPVPLQTKHELVLLLQ